MSFDVATDAYASFMGRFSEPLAGPFVDLVGPRHGQRALDVGCGTGAATALLVSRLGIDAVAAIDPSPSFVAAVRRRFPGLDVRSGVAEQLPFGDGQFDLTLAQLVVHFMTDPVAGLTEMARVTRPGGTVAACVWDHAGPRGPLYEFWQAVREIEPDAVDESQLAGAREGHLAELCVAAGLSDIGPGVLTVRIRFETFADWWEPFTFGVGPAGTYVASLDPTRVETLRSTCERRLPPPPFEVSASAWCVRAKA